MSYRIEIVGRPAPKGSRIAARTKAGRPYTYAASKYEVPWINAVRDATRNVMRHHTQEEPPYAVELSFRLALPGKPQHVWPTTHDLDKLIRAVIDGLVKGGAISDDRHVTEIQASKHYVQPGQEPGATVDVHHQAEAQTRAA